MKLHISNELTTHDVDSLNYYTDKPSTVSCNRRHEVLLHKCRFVAVADRFLKQAANLRRFISVILLNILLVVFSNTAINLTHFNGPHYGHVYSMRSMQSS